MSSWWLAGVHKKGRGESRSIPLGAERRGECVGGVVDDGGDADPPGFLAGGDVCGDGGGGDVVQPALRDKNTKQKVTWMRKDKAKKMGQVGGAEYVEVHRETRRTAAGRWCSGEELKQPGGTNRTGMLGE